MTPKMVSVLTENWTMTDPRDLRRIIRMAQEAEDAGFDMVMVSDHILMGPSAGDKGRMENPRDYAMPGNQDPATAWPSSLILLSAIAAVTTKIRIGAIALITPLRHPLALAKDLATLDLISEGRLVIQPTVSWHQDEYRAMGVSFSERGKILDEQLEILKLAWAQPVASFTGNYFNFENVYIEPKPFREAGPRMWFGGEKIHAPLMRRLIEYGSGFHPLGKPKAEDIAALSSAVNAAGRNMSEFELVGGTRVEFPDENTVAPLGPALAGIPEQMELGFSTFCIKPSIFIDDVDQHANFCAQVMKEVNSV